MNILSFYLKKQSIELSFLQIDNFNEYCKKNIINKTVYLSTLETAAQLLIHSINVFLKELNINKLDYIATSCGPGSFTNIRIQLSSVLGLSIGFDAKKFCPNTFDTLKAISQNKNIIIDDYKAGGFCYDYCSNQVSILTKEDLLNIDCNNYIFENDVNIANCLIDFFINTKDVVNYNSINPYYCFTPNYKISATTKK